MGGMQGTPAEKAISFGPSARRLVGRLHPERAIVLIVIVFGVLSVLLSVAGPALLGLATNIIVDGVFGPTGSGGLVGAGTGIDFPALHALLGGVLLVYVFSSVLAWAQAYASTDENT